MGKVCTSSCPYYGVDENYNGYCKKDHNSYRERFAPCNMESDTPASTPAPSAPTLHKEPRTCTSSCPYYGVDADYNGYCRKDHNSYRERFATCNMGEYTLTSGGGGSTGGGGGTGCSKWVILVVVALLLLGGVGILMDGQKAEELPARDESGEPTYSDTVNGGDDANREEPTTTTTQPQEGDTMYVVADGGLRMREQPATDSKVILTVPTKSQVLVLSTEGDWSYVRYNGKEGWCASAWIYRSIADATSATSTTTTTTAPTGTDSVRIVTEGINEANRHIESYRGKTVSNAHTKESLTEDEVMTLFRNAYNLYMDYAWGNITGGFTPIGGPVYENVPILGSMDGVWRPGSHPEFPDFDTLVRSYYAYFADDLAARYLRDKIALINAKMYYTTYPGMGDEGVRSEVSYAVETVADGYTVKVTAHYYRDYDNPDQITETKYLDFPLRKEDGAWVFTKMQWIPT